MTQHIGEPQLIFNEGFKHLFDILDDGLILLDLNGRIIQVNRFLCGRLGYTGDELVGKSVSQIDQLHCTEKLLQRMGEIQAFGKATFEAEYIQKDGAVMPADVSFKQIELHGSQLILAKVMDIAERKKSENAASLLAYYDPLTELPNRRLMLERLHHASAAGNRSELCSAILFLGLDNFKAANNIWGHDAGDALLQQVARRLQSVLRESDTLARFGGDEFVVILEALCAEREGAAGYAKATADKLLAALSKPCDLNGKKYKASASIGIVLLRGGAKEDVNELLKYADIAMYEAKTAGRNTVRFFDQAMQSAIEQKARMNAGMRAALRLRRFIPYYQKQVDSQGRVNGAEVLIRWSDPARGLILPGAFISLAEESGLIVSIGRWMLEEACLQLKAWEQQEHTKEITLSVNVSSREFSHADFVGRLRSILERTGANPSLLELEITESMVLANIDDLVAKMRSLRKIGVSFALDDFGTGYSSLSYLKRLPLNKVKIDQSFVKDLGVDKNDEAIVLAIIQLGKTLGLQVTAEGVETELQRRVLAQHGCHCYQGYLFGKPVPIGTFEQELGNDNCLSRWSR